MIRRSLLLTAALCALCDAADAQSFVYDTRAMASDGSWNSNQLTFMGGAAAIDQAGYPHDTQAVDDFTLTTRTRLTQVTLDMIATTAGSGDPADGFLVEVFSNIAGNHPAETPTVSFLAASTAVVMSGSFQQSTTPSQASLPGDRHTWVVDLTGANIVLDPGTWWLSVTPKNDSDPFGSAYRSIGNFATTGVAAAHYRCGGIDHGNNYPCVSSATNPLPDWRALNMVFSQPVNLSRRIEGEEVQSVQGACCAGTACSVVAGAGACLGGAYQGDNSACGPTGNPTTCCPANYNGTDGLSVQDIFDFLAGWFSVAPAADFNGIGGITVQDIFAFLAAWFGGC